MESKHVMQETGVKTLSIEGYLHMERGAEQKHEYYKGEVFAMSVASVRHNRVQMNLTREIGNLLKGKDCEIFGSDLRVHIPSNSLFTYPDAVIICGELELLDSNKDTLLNPVVIFEVLSKWTQSYDRGDKFMLYRAIPSLQEYILVGSEGVSLEQYTRQESGNWILKELKDSNAVLTLPSVDVTLSLAEIYAGIDLV